MKDNIKTVFIKYIEKLSKDVKEDKKYFSLWTLQMLYDFHAIEENNEYLSFNLSELQSNEKFYTNRSNLLAHIECLEKYSIKTYDYKTDSDLYNLHKEYMDKLKFFKGVYNKIYQSFKIGDIVIKTDNIYEYNRYGKKSNMVNLFTVKDIKYSDRWNDSPNQFFILDPVKDKKDEDILLDNNDQWFLTDGYVIAL